MARRTTFQKGNKLGLGRAAHAKPVLNIHGVVRCAQSHAEEMLLIQVQIARNKRNSPAVRLEAAEKVLCRAHGKPHQSVEVKRVDDTSDKSVADLKLAFLDKLSRILGDSPSDLPAIEGDAVEVESDDGEV